MKTVLLSPINDFSSYAKSKTISELRTLHSQLSKKEESQIWWKNPPKVYRPQLLSLQEILNCIESHIKIKAK